jgi:hypothetical protein
MSHQKHRRKLFWPLGLISLTVLPLMFFVYLKDNPAAHTKCTMEINLWPVNHEEFISRWALYTGETADIDTPPDGLWNVFKFSSNETENINALEQLHKEIIRFKLQRDTIRGIEVRLDSKMSYNRFVKILDVLYNEDITRYNIIKSTIWVYKYPRQKFLKEIGPFPIYGLDVIVLEPSNWLERFDYKVSVWKWFWKEEVTQIPLPITLTWSMLLILNIVRINKWHNMNKPHRFTNYQS